jgi:hypothetical protein
MLVSKIIGPRRSIIDKYARQGRRLAILLQAASLGAAVLQALGAGPARTAELRPITPIATVRIARMDQFVARDTFTPGRRIGGRMLSAVGLTFAEHFLGVVEDKVPATTLKVWSLEYTMGDVSIVRWLGGEARAAVTSIAHVYRLIEADEVASHTDGRSNIAYVRSPVDKRLWAVHWSVNSSNEWTVGAVYVPHDHLDWHAETRLLSPMIGAVNGR